MELYLHTGLVLVLLLHLSQSQDPAPSSLNPESTLPILGDLMNAVKSVFEQAANISRDYVLREVSEQAVEKNRANQPPEYPGTQQTTAEDPKSLDREQKQTKLIDSAEQLHKGMNKLAEKSVRESSQLESVQDQVKTPEMTFPESEEAVGFEPNSKVDTRDESKDKHPNKEKPIKPGESPVEAFEQNVESVKEQQTIDLGGVGADQQNSQNWERMAESQPTRDQKYGVVTEVVAEGDSVVETEQKATVDGEGEKAYAGEDSSERRAEKEDLAPKSKTRMTTMQELVEVVLDTMREESNTMDDIMDDNNAMNYIRTSRDPLLDAETPTLGNVVHELRPFLILGTELGEMDELVEESADKTKPASPKQDSWKIGAIAVACVLILQSAVTAVYILKCKSKQSSGTAQEKACEDGLGGVERDVANSDMTIPPDERCVVDDLSIYSQVQEESFAMGRLHTEHTMEKTLKL